MENFQSPCLGTLFASKGYGKRDNYSKCSFNPHAWGLFLQDEERYRQRQRDEAFNPHAWGLFLQVYAEDASNNEPSNPLSIPMLGDSFCKPTRRCSSTRFTLTTFNPHAWGLFLQAYFNIVDEIIATVELSIPMLGDSFCKCLIIAAALAMLSSTFNPHAWGLFLQVDKQLVRCAAMEPFNPHAWGLFLQDYFSGLESVFSNMQLSIPMLGDSFCKPTKWGWVVYYPEKLLSIPMLGDSFCKAILHLSHFRSQSNFQSPCLGTLFASPVAYLQL